MKTISITIFIAVFSLTAFAQQEQEKKTYCNLLTKTISYMSSVDSEPFSNQSMFDDEGGCFINGIQFENRQTYSSFHIDVVKFFMESGTPPIKTIYPWQYNKEKEVYLTSFTTTYEGFEIKVVMTYNSEAKACVIRVF
jgi:hypothetical protein